MIKLLTKSTGSLITSLGLILIIIVSTSCDTGFRSKGLIVDKSTGLPMDSVTINVKNKFSTYTDSLGKYAIDTMMYGNAGDLEVLFSKAGYKTHYVNFRNNKINDNTIIEMTRLENGTKDLSIEKEVISKMYYFNMIVISVLNLLTLLFIVLKKEIKWKIVWISGVLLLNLTLFFSITDGSISKFIIFNGPIYLTHFSVYPFSMKIVIPIASLLFWSLYLINKNKLMKVKI